MFWSCDHLKPYCIHETVTTSQVCGLTIGADPRIRLLEDVTLLNFALIWTTFLYIMI